MNLVEAVLFYSMNAQLDVVFFIYLNPGCQYIRAVLLWQRWVLQWTFDLYQANVTLM